MQIAVGFDKKLKKKRGVEQPVIKGWRSTVVF